MGASRFCGAGFWWEGCSRVDRCCLCGSANPATSQYLNLHRLFATCTSLQLIKSVRIWFYCVTVNRDWLLADRRRYVAPSRPTLATSYRPEVRWPRGSRPRRKRRIGSCRRWLASTPSPTSLTSTTSMLKRARSESYSTLAARFNLCSRHNMYPFASPAASLDFLCMQGYCQKSCLKFALISM